MMCLPSFFIAFLFFLIGCVPTQEVRNIKYAGYSVGRHQQVDSTYVEMLSYYADSVNKTMGEYLVENEADLLKETPNSALGNFLADAYLWAAKSKIDPRAEIAFMNHGGVRIFRIAKGPVNRGMIYEIMPFDNLICIVEVKGNILKNYLNRIAQEGGGSGQSGVTMRLENNQATDISINGTPLDLNRTYFMVNSDYQVDGGGGFTAFKNLQQNRSAYLQRDAIIDYCKWLKMGGKKINHATLKRIVK
jgi:2',3'-cyclic-nucleotide 2'-phosphodiesterase (5'-nucleotidase family)